MKKYDVYLYYYEDDQLYSAVCPEFFNFILYHDSEDGLKRSILNCLAFYTRNVDISDSDINYIKISKESINQDYSCEQSPMM